MFQLHMQVGWLGAAVCAVLSARLAREFFVGVPRFFGCLALLALAWVMLLPFYGRLITSPLLPGFGSFLLVHAGGLIRSEVRGRQTLTEAAVDPVSQLALVLLIPLAIPSVPFQQLADLGLRAEYFQLVSATILGVMGYTALWLGVKAVTGGAGILYYAMSALTVAYSGLEVWFLMGQFRNVGSSGNLVLADFEAYGFALAKLALTSMVGYALIHYNNPDLSVTDIVLRTTVGVRRVRQPAVQV